MRCDIIRWLDAPTVEIDAVFSCQVFCTPVVLAQKWVLHKKKEERKGKVK